MNKAYRNDLQGLRGIAIILVLLFHFRLAGMTGGFIGVDVFFVLSGYLMTGLLLRKAGEPLLPVLESFYWKRIWRIVPAYLATLVMVMVAAWFVLLPVDLIGLGESGIYATVFTSNFRYTFAAGYFETDSIFKPLLHTWSLAVEMQFYVVWPLIILLANRLGPKTQVLLIAILTLLSYVGAIFQGILDPDVTFYALPFRVWEFGIGGLIAHPLVIEYLARWQKAIRLSLLPSLAAILVSALVFDKYLLWPAPFALLPVAATALLITGGTHNQKGASYTLLSLPILVQLGEISYSLYLVHWPVVTMMQTLLWPEPAIWVRIVALVACIPFSWLLYRLVEMPLREIGRTPMINYLKLVPGTLVSAGIVVFGLLVVKYDGFPDRFGEGVSRQLAGLTKATERKIPCTGLVGAEKIKLCLGALDNSNNPVSVVLWGDSHSIPWYDTLVVAAASSGQSVEIRASGACPPSIGVTRQSSHLQVNKRCPASNIKALEFILANDGIKTVFLIARWALYTETTRFGTESGSRAFVISPEDQELSVENSRRQLEAGLERLVGRLRKANKDVVIVSQVPELGFNGPRCLMMVAIGNQNIKNCAVDLEETRLRQAVANKMLVSLKSRWPGVIIFDPKKVLCDSSKCQAAIRGKSAYRDDDHILSSTADLVFRQLNMKTW